jgi:hypothetical protein
MTTNSSTDRTFNIAAIVTAINVLVASGFSIAGLIAPKSILPADAVTTQASFIFAMYAAARTIPLAVTAFVIIYKRLVSALVVIGILAGSVQAIDALIGLYQKDVGKFLGPLVLAVLQFVAVRALYKSTRF